MMPSPVTSGRWLGYWTGTFTRGVKQLHKWTQLGRPVLCVEILPLRCRSGCWLHALSQLSVVSFKSRCFACCSSQSPSIEVLLLGLGCKINASQCSTEWSCNSWLTSLAPVSPSLSEAETGQNYKPNWPYWEQNWRGVGVLFLIPWAYIYLSNMPGRIWMLFMAVHLVS